MPKFLLDTSCIVAAVCTWHEHHNSAAYEIERRINRGEKMIVAAPALVEAYAVLTRLPSPHRISPIDATALIESNFINVESVIALDGKSYIILLHQAPNNGITGGQIYDAVIANCALKAKAEALLTFNENHFLSFAEKIEIVVPGKVKL